MDARAAIVALVSVWGAGIAAPVLAQEGGIVSESGSNPLLNRVWVRADEVGLPGPMRIFLEDGTLLSDSCWETYRLSRWRQLSPTEIAWEEDGVTIPAEIVEVSDTSLILAIALVGGETEEQRYRPAEVPYVCPDMER